MLQNSRRCNSRVFFNGSAYVAEISVIVDLIAQNSTEKELNRKIDVFFYIDQNRQAKRIYSDMKDDRSQVLELYKTLCELELRVKARWREDFKFIATPVSLHDYLIG